MADAGVVKGVFEALLGERAWGALCRAFRTGAYGGLAAELLACANPLAMALRAASMRGTPLDAGLVAGVLGQLLGAEVVTALISACGTGEYGAVAAALGASGNWLLLAGKQRVFVSACAIIGQIPKTNSNVLLQCCGVANPVREQC